MDDEIGPERSLPIYRWEGRKLGVLFDDITVYGRAGSIRRVDDLVFILRNIALWPYSVFQETILQQKPPTRALVQHLTRVLNPGETLLVLGSPGAVCTTTLKVLANRHVINADIRGDLNYSEITPAGMARHYRSEVVYNDEKDIHFPTLRVKDTLNFGLRLRKPARAYLSTPDKRFASSMADGLMNLLGIGHTAATIVGNSFIRVVSGGERKRVSLAEALATNPAIAGWDNPIRGLDSSSALEFLKNLKLISTTTGMTNIVNVFDKVLVLYKGRTIYFGPTCHAKSYFMSIGFEPLHRQTTPEFLTTITSPRERRISTSYAGPLYLDPDALEARFQTSEIFAQTRQEMAIYRERYCQNSTSTVDAFHQSVAETVSKYRVLNTIEPHTVMKQVSVSMTGFTRLFWSGRNSFITILCLTIINAVVCGSGFYEAPLTSTDSSERSCALYFPLVYFFLNALTGVNKTIDARNILLKQHMLGFIHPVSFVITQAFGGSAIIPASDNHIFMLLLFHGRIAEISQMIGAWAPSMSIALLMMGSAIPIVTLYTGYAPPLPTQLGWSSWMRRIAPTPYALEALLRNEFYNLELHCTDDELVPSGPGNGDLWYQGCPLPGAEPGSRTASWAYYLETLYGYSRHHLWRNFGIILAMWFVYTVLAAIGLTVMTREKNSSSGPMFKANARSLHEGSSGNPDYEPHSHTTFANGEVTEEKNDLAATQDSRLFRFENITYTVTTDGGPKRLLDEVSGYVKSGQLTALMGASDRKSFQRSCGFCMQKDIHEPLMTVREAFQFLTYLRQLAETAHAVEMAYVEHIISLLNIEPLADAIIGDEEDGLLSVEQRKRVTIGVKLAAQPTDLLFLDEPTSGLDSQAAISIVSFLQRIAAEGIPIICTIHQPSGVIFEMFDHVLLLARGGKTICFGETGHNSQVLVEYFGRYGALMTEVDNPAEYILSTITSPGESRDWIQKLKDDLPPSSKRAPAAQRAYAQPFSKQVYAIVSRHWTTVWRYGQYNFSRLFKCLFYELIISFTFFQAGTDLQSLQYRMLGVLLATWIILVNAADMQAVWFNRWAVFEGRERNGIYNYKALVIALLTVEIPYNIILYTLVFLCSFWTMGFPSGTPAIAGFTYFMFLLLSLFGPFFPSRTTAGYANSLFWVVLLIFSGLPVPHTAINDFYRPWLFWTDTAAERDLARFIPPAGSSCAEYAASFLGINPGYSVNGDARDVCAYCKYSSGDDYVATLDFAYGDRWRDWAVFLGFCLTNVGVVVWGTWLLRVEVQRLKGEVW
ncbi:ABC transporter-like protein [Aspergillus stella-maris]|uniref:ABC transporter-like protein n=1 Tax=Aspergillus stella-maris TaxID=1810926 RepID=UPI003CCCFA66